MTTAHVEKFAELVGKDPALLAKLPTHRGGNMKCHFLNKLLVAAVLLYIIQAPAQAQSFPSKVVRIIVPFPTGAGADTTLRLFTPKFTEITAQPFIVENRAGAAGHIGGEVAARAPADGYNLLLVPASLASSISLYKDLKYDLVRDFAPIAMLASAPFVVAVHLSVPAKTIKEFIAYAQANPGKLNFASPGAGTPNHLAAELFKSMAGVDMVNIPYKGTSTAVPALVAGDVSLMFTSTVSSLPLVKAGKLRALAISSAKRSLAAPDLPTVSESGLPGFEAATWFALFTPTGTSQEIISKLNFMSNIVAKMPDIRDVLMKQGAEPQTLTPDQLGSYVKNEVVKWAKIISFAGVKME